MWDALALNIPMPNGKIDLNNNGAVSTDDIGHNHGWPAGNYAERERIFQDHVTYQRGLLHYLANDPAVPDGRTSARVVVDGVARNEGDVQVTPAGPYGISFRAIVPRRGECPNLVVPVAVSASHIAFGSVRMEPVFMLLGHAAVRAADLALAAGAAVQDVDYPTLRRGLLADGMVLG